VRLLPPALILTGLLSTAPLLTAQTADDSLGIKQAALNYIEGWYTGNGDRMAQALHPELAKRIMFSDSLGNVWIRSMGASELIRGTRAGGGAKTPASDRRTDVRILDIFQNAASVRVDAGGWIDYLHLVRWKGQWEILNVLWEIRQAGNRQ
jgi:putative lumazine-binding protein